jgi:hypothetical protein
MKGRTPTADQKRFHDMLCQNVGCLPCFQDNGERNTYVSVHHMDGRTKPLAHWWSLGLCAGHHQKGSGVNRGLLAIHGDKRAFEREYGTELELHRKGIQQLIEMGCTLPATMPAILLLGAKP